MHGRRRFGAPEDRELADNEEVVAWMANDALVTSAVWGLRRMEMWLALRVLRGLDLEEFLEGSAHAYGVVSRLMYRRQWDKLEPLVSPDCLDAMQFTMEQFGDAGQRIEGIDADDAIRVRSNLLCRAQVMKEAGDEGLSSDAADGAPRRLVRRRREVCDLRFQHQRARRRLRRRHAAAEIDLAVRGRGVGPQEGEWRLHAII